MTYEENVRAILECCFSQSKDEIIDRAVKAIIAIKPEPVTIPIPTPSIPDPVVLPYTPYVPPYYTNPNPLSPYITCDATLKDLKTSQNSDIIKGTKDKE